MAFPAFALWHMTFLFTSFYVSLWVDIFSSHGSKCSLRAWYIPSMFIIFIPFYALRLLWNHHYHPDRDSPRYVNNFVIAVFQLIGYLLVFGFMVNALYNKVVHGCHLSVTFNVGTAIFFPALITIPSNLFMIFFGMDQSWGYFTAWLNDMVTLVICCLGLFTLSGDAYVMSVIVIVLYWFRFVIMSLVSLMCKPFLGVWKALGLLNTVLPALVTFGYSGNALIRGTPEATAWQWLTLINLVICGHWLYCKTKMTYIFPFYESEEASEQEEEEHPLQPRAQV